MSGKNKHTSNVTFFIASSRFAVTMRNRKLSKKRLRVLDKKTYVGYICRAGCLIRVLAVHLTTL